MKENTEKPNDFNAGRASGPVSRADFKSVGGRPASSVGSTPASSATGAPARVFSAERPAEIPSTPHPSPTRVSESLIGDRTERRAAKNSRPQPDHEAIWAGLPLELLHLKGETVAAPAHRLDHRRLFRVVFELAPKSADLDVDRPVFRPGLPTKQPIAAQHWIGRRPTPSRKARATATIKLAWQCPLPGAIRRTYTHSEVYRP